MGNKRKPSLSVGRQAAMLTPRQSLIYFAKVIVIGVAIIVALLFAGGWALRPYLDSRGTLIDGPPVYTFRFVQPHWLSSRSAWPLAEAIVRSAVLGHGVLFFVVWWVLKRVRTRPDHALPKISN